MDMNYVAVSVFASLMTAGALYWVNQILRSKANAQTEPISAPVVYEHWIEIFYKDGDKSRWFKADSENRGPVFFWRDFYKWYFGTDKGNYVLVVKDRNIVIPRTRIDYFETIVKKAES